MLLAGATVSQAADMSGNTQTNRTIFDVTEVNTDQLYRSCEVTLEGFGTGSLDSPKYDSGTKTYSHQNPRPGGGAGLEFFFTRHIGIEAEGFWQNGHPSWVDSYGGNLVFRYPFGNTGFAPYIFAGGGHRCDPRPGAYGDGGLGLEYRFNNWLGVFLDARMVASAHVSNYGIGRLGLRFAF